MEKIIKNQVIVQEEQRQTRHKQHNKCVIYRRNISKEHSYTMYIKYKISISNTKHRPKEPQCTNNIVLLEIGTHSKTLKQRSFGSSLHP